MLTIRALEGCRVIDLTRLLPGPAATQTLVNFGAEVIKVEEPGAGDPTRVMPISSLFDRVNRGKKSVVLNLKDPSERESFLHLVDTADVLIEQFRPGVMDRLGVGYPVLSARNSRLIYCALTGYGYDSPYRDLAGHDINYLALAGVLDLIGAAAGAPAIPGVQIADLSGGAQQAVTGILLALVAREKTGRGQFVDVSMLDGSAALLPIPLSNYEGAGRIPRRGQELLSGRYACYNVYQARDSRWLAVGALERKFWTTLCTLLECPELIADQFAEGPRREEILALIREKFAARDAEDWFAFFRGHDACVTPVRTLEEVLADEHFRRHPIGLTPLLSETPATEEGRSPKLGEHTHEILESLKGARR